MSIWYLLFESPINRTKTFYREKTTGDRSEFVPRPRFLASVHMLCKTQRKDKDKGGDEDETPEPVQPGTAGNRVIGGLFRDLGIVEPDDNPLSCLADEEDVAGGRRPKMRFLVAPVDPELAVSYSW